MLGVLIGIVGLCFVVVLPMCGYTLINHTDLKIAEYR